MYKLSVPIAVFGNKFNKEQALTQLKRVNADRVFLALGTPYFDRKKRAKQLEPLKTAIPYFKEYGLEVGVWLWTFMRADPENASEDMERITGFDGKKCDNFFCASSEAYMMDTAELLSDIARLDPDIIMFDDDYRFGCLPSGMGCCCENHLKMMSERLGEPIEREGLAEKVFCGGSNKYRDAYLDSLGDSLRNFAKRMREAVDGVNENIRIAVCSVMSLWDQDGTNAVEIAKILAGNTKPLMRYIGAPYWAVDKFYGCRLQHTIETERMESAWCKNSSVETMAEGDSWPRPRYTTPSSYLEIFDTALRAAEASNGILKYMYDYYASVEYELGHANRHCENSELYKKINSMFSGKNDIGITVHERMDKIRSAKFSENKFIGVGYIENTFFSPAAKVLSDNTIPTTYTQKSGVGIAFGENVRHLTKEDFGNGLMIDVTAAKILMEQGIDVGIEEIGANVTDGQLYYNGQNEYTLSHYANGGAYRIKPKEEAVVLTETVNGDERYPDTIFYKNEQGQKFVVFGFDGYAINEGRYRSYCMQNLLHDCYKMLSDKSFPFICKGNPDLYMLVCEDENEVAIGLWNICADKISKPIIKLAGTYKNIECVGCTGTITDGEIRLSPIAAYESAFLLLKK